MKIKKKRRSQHYLIFDYSLYCFKTPKLIWQIKWFKNEREGCVPATHSLDGGLKVQKTFLLYIQRRYACWQHRTMDTVWTMYPDYCKNNTAMLSASPCFKKDVHPDQSLWYNSTSFFAGSVVADCQCNYINLDYLSTCDICDNWRYSYSNPHTRIKVAVCSTCFVLKSQVKGPISIAISQHHLRSLPPSIMIQSRSLSGTFQL